MGLYEAGACFKNVMNLEKLMNLVVAYREAAV